MGKLNQVIAVVAGKKKKATDCLTEAYHQIQKTTLFEGLSRVYQPKDDEGERLPSEAKIVQVKCAELIAGVRRSLAEMYDIIATQDYANCEAKADIVVSGVTVLPAVPVTHLLFIEKQVTDLETFIARLPVLDPGEQWAYDNAAGCWATIPSESTRTKKVPKAFVKYEATKEHPAQVETFHEDIQVGTWKTVKFSGAVPAKEKNELLDRVRALREGVVHAREQANGMEVKTIENVGNAVLNFVFGK